MVLSVGGLRGFMRVVLLMRVPFRTLCVRVLYYIGDIRRDPNLENYPCAYGV